MLDEYGERTRAVGASAVAADLAAFEVGSDFDVAICLGDTVSHLPSWEAVRSFLQRVSGALRGGAAFLLATRDHTKVYEGDDRFLLVRGDAEQSLTCFLDMISK